MYCSNCNRPLTNDANFCTWCGAKVDAADIPPVPESTQKHCAKCSSPLEENSKFCTKCGAPVEGAIVTTAAEDDHTQSPPIPTTENAAPKAAASRIILARSSVYTQELETWRKNALKVCSIWTIAFIICLTIICMGPYLVELLQGNDHITMENWSWITMCLGLIITGFIAPKFIERINEVYARCQPYCETESLILDDEKIYGESSKGRVLLSYEDISSVTFQKYKHNEPIFGQIPSFENNMLRIRDQKGNYYTFYSFINCNELKSIIDLRIAQRA